MHQRPNRVAGLLGQKQGGAGPFFKAAPGQDVTLAAAHRFWDGVRRAGGRNGRGTRC